ncbi:MAG: hypothetical protein E7179_02215 [Erysipelotrichaceae bacterium]|jgi:hypothetical protein|nr:hypothetical protein [Erysipelotrichaceae bacterium]
MKKAKLTLGLVLSLVSVVGLTACNEATYSDGVVLTYKDASGNKVSYTAEELFGDYQRTSGVASTDFDHIQEVLIRKYYESPSRASVLKALKLDAENDVLDVKKTAETNASNNKTSYQEEFEKLLDSSGAENVDELFQIKLYQREKDKFTTDYESELQVEYMRDGKNAAGENMFPYSAEYGRGSDGYLKDQMPYTVSHILVKVAGATNGDHTSAKITETESGKLGNVVMLMANASKKANRDNFGKIAYDESEDPGSAAKWGLLSVMDRDQADDFVQEFRFGVYAYDAIYNKINQNAATNSYAQKEIPVPDGSEDKYKVIENIRYGSNATYTDPSTAQTADEIAAGLQPGEHYVNNFFKSEDYSNIGVIPFGAAVALASEKYAKKPSLDFKVNDDNETYLPRNILFNKYFNNHRVAVIVPTRIPADDALDGKVTKLSDNTELSGVNYSKANELKLLKGVKDDDYAALDGFAKDTSSLLTVKDANGADVNCLTTEKGQIVLAVRAGASGNYEGIHFIVIDRSALDEYVTVNADGSYSRVEGVDPAAYPTSDLNTKSDTTSLSQYYTIHVPTDVEFPTYENGEEGQSGKTTYVNPYESHNKETYKGFADELKGKISSYNSNKDTFIFQSLMSDGSVTFAENAQAKQVKSLVLSWIRSKRNSNAIKGRENFDESWATYIEYLTQQDQARALKDDGSQKLVSETCALGYGDANSKNKTGEWAVGGACYAK